MEYKLLALVLLLSAVRVQGISFGTRYIEDVSYLAELFDNYQSNHSCSAFVLFDKALLTAAHCVQKINSLAIMYVAPLGGDLLIPQDEIRKPAILHPNYNEETNENDFAVVMLSQSLYIKPLPRVTTTETTKNTTCIVSGYGTDVSGAFNSLFPRFKEVEVTACNEPMPGQICAVGQINSTYKAGVLCDGDAGAPLVCNNEMVGIAVSDNNCGTGGPDVYQSVMGFQAWIDEQITNAAIGKPIPTSTSTTTANIPTTTSTKDSGSTSTSVLNPSL